jgi:hypothetical protein
MSFVDAVEEVVFEKAGREETRMADPKTWR